MCCSIQGASFFTMKNTKDTKKKLGELKTELKIEFIENDSNLKYFPFFSSFVLFVAFVVKISEPVPADSYGFSPGSYGAYKIVIFILFA